MVDSSAVKQRPGAQGSGAQTLPLSVFTITLNEETNIGRLLESVKPFAGEIVVVDSGSTDQTTRIARRYGARVIEHPWEGYSRQKQFALEQCSNDWCLCLDADEAVTPEMAARLPELIDDPDAAAFRFGRKDSYVGSIAPDGMHQQGGTRLLRKSRCRFDTSRTVHEKVIVEGETRLADVPFLHFGYDDLSMLTGKNNAYSTLKAREKAARHPRPSLLRLVFSGPVKFFQFYFIQRNFLWGWRGFVRSVSTAYYGFSVEAKRFELSAISEQDKTAGAGDKG